MARTNTLGNFLTDVADAIRTKKGSQELIAAADFDTEIENISGISMPAMENDVMFYDYDGTVVYSYTKDEFLALEAMPAVPTHNGLTAQGWNWTLEELQDYVEDYGVGQAGATYTPTDGKTKIDIEINSEELDLYLCLGVNGTVTIEWGDNSTSQDITGTNSTLYTQHIYPSPGKYTIILQPGENSSVTLPGQTGNGGCLFTITNTWNNANFARRRHIVTGLIIGNDTVIGTCGAGYPAMKYIILPQTLNVANMSYVTFSPIALRVLIYPRTYTTVFSAQYGNEASGLMSVIYPPNLSSGPNGRMLSNNYCARRFLPTGTRIMQYTCSGAKALSLVVIPKTITDIRDSVFENCSNLTKIVMGCDNLTKIPYGFVQNCTSLTEIIIPSSITKFDTNCFYGCTNLSKVDCSGLSVVPTLTSLNNFSNVPTDCKIMVPDDLYESWVVASNWSSLSSKIYPYDSNGNEMTKATITLATDSSTDAVINAPTSVLTVVTHTYTLPSYSDLTTTSLEENLQFSDGTNTYSLGDTITVTGDATFTLIDTSA